MSGKFSADPDAAFSYINPVISRESAPHFPVQDSRGCLKNDWRIVMKEIVTCKRMKELDNAAIYQMGIPSCVLMERAALKTAEEIKKHFQKIYGTSEEYKKEKVLVVCGSGNNGGDGIAIARLLYLEGVDTSFFVAGSENRMTEETRNQYRIASNYGVPVVHNVEWAEYTTIVDALFGVGLARPVEGAYRELIMRMNETDAWKVAVDIPSGVDGDTGKELGIAFHADLTVTFAFRKRGLCFYPGRMYAGRIVVADIGIYGADQPQDRTWHLEQSDLGLLPERVVYGNKGTFGKVLVVAGTEGMCGAAYLCASAALAGGAGMVKIQTEEANRVPLQILLPEAMVTCAFTEEANRKSLDWCDVLVIGPGLGISGKSRERAEWFLKNASLAQKPVILDADGLNLLAMHPAWNAWLSERVTVTPHLGEMSRLTGKSIDQIQCRMAETAEEYAAGTDAVCVLKDACTVVADKNGHLYLNLAGNPGMATAGSGDVLSGILAAVACMYLQKKENAPDPGLCAALGVYLHAKSGDQAAEETGTRGMKARDLIRMLPSVLAKIR